MPPIYDPGSAGRVRIKGTDPRVRGVTDRIGRGSQPTGRDRMTADMQAEMAGRRPSDADVNDDFARRLTGEQFPDDTRVRPGYSQFTHETDAGNVESIRRGGIRPTLGGANFGDERPQVYGSRANSVENIPEGRVRIRYQVPTDSIIGGNQPARGPSSRGLGVSNAVSSRGAVPPGNVMSGYGPSGRIFDAGSRTVGLMALLGTAAQFIPGFSERMPRTTWLANGGPIGDLLQSVIAGNYGPGGAMDPYRDMRDMPGFNPATGTVPA